jgi:hypothetical protein
MITCPWCGTNYQTFQSNCSNCGGPLPAASERTGSLSGETLSPPPLAPRPISDRYAWRLLFADGWWIVALVFGILGLIFSLVGAGLSISKVTSFVGIPFLLIGVPMLGIGVWVFIARYQNARKVVYVLRDGKATPGQIADVQENYSVTINGRHPWLIRYQFQANGQEYQGTVSTMNRPGERLQAGNATYVLYLPDAPKWNSIYPHP